MQAIRLKTLFLPVIIGIVAAFFASTSLKHHLIMDDGVRNLVAFITHHGIDLGKVKRDVISVIQQDMERRKDGTSLIGTFVRLAWHCSGTYSAEDDTGGSNGGKIRHEPERSWGANAGLTVATEALEPVKELHPSLSYADLYTFAGAVAIEHAGGPHIPFFLGRVDDEDGSQSPPDGRLPDADKDNEPNTYAKTTAHMREIFHRMGFTDREMVCLIGAHTLGRCHIDRSGYWGPWNKAENKFNNALYKFLLDKKWTVKRTHQGRKWNGPLQYENDTGELMMLPSCMAMIHDDEMLRAVEEYAADEALFYREFAAAFGKLLALGVPQKPWHQIFC